MYQNEANTFRYVKELAQNAMYHLTNEKKKDEYSAKIVIARIYDFAKMCEDKHNNY